MLKNSKKVKKTKTLGSVKEFIIFNFWIRTLNFLSPADNETFHNLIYLLLILTLFKINTLSKPECLNLFLMLVLIVHGSKSFRY